MKTKKYIIIASLLLSLGLVGKAEAATMSVSPISSSPADGSTFTVNVLLDTTGASIDGADINALNYDATALEVQDANASLAGVQITAGTLMPNTVYNVVTGGKIYFSQLPNPGSKFVGSGILATITFKALKVGTTALTFNFTNGSTLDSNVAVGLTDALSSVTNGSYTVVVPPDITLPTATITAPTANATLSGTAATLSANASDNIGVVGVKFLVDSNLVGVEDTAAPYSVVLNTTSLSNATHSIVVVARDAAGNTFTSPAVSFIVNNIVPKQPKTISIPTSSFEGASTLSSYPSATVQVLDPTGKTLSTQTLTGNASGQYTLNFQQTDPQLVTLRVSVAGYLAKKVANVDTTVVGTVAVPQMLAGDFNSDGVINSLDYSLMNAKWNQTSTLNDINKDSTVNSLDFAVLSKNWLQQGE